MYTIYGPISDKTFFKWFKLRKIVQREYTFWFICSKQNSNEKKEKRTCIHDDSQPLFTFHGFQYSAISFRVIFILFEAFHKCSLNKCGSVYRFFFFVLAICIDAMLEINLGIVVIIYGEMKFENRQPNLKLMNFNTNKRRKKTLELNCQND